MNNRVDPLSSAIWENGDFVIDDSHFQVNISYLELLAKVYLIGDNANIFAKDRNFQKALYDIYKNAKKFNEDRLLVKLRTHFGRVNIKTDYKTYKKILGELYNSRLSGDKHHVITQEKEVANVA
jgi:hypothetical protein